MSSTVDAQNGQDLQEHLLNFYKILRELKSSGPGAKMEERNLCQLLLTLPKSFDSVVTATMKVEVSNL